MAESRFVYVTYVNATTEKLWKAFIDPEFTRQFWSELSHGRYGSGHLPVHPFSPG